MNEKFLSILAALIFVLGFAGISIADNGAFADFNAQYPGKSYGCTLCHTSPPTLNPYGSALLGQGASANNIDPAMFVAVEPLDSDGDGFTNIEEINADTLPGDPTSFPPPADTTAPVVTTFTIPPTSSSLTVTIASFEATDAVGVTGYLVTESSTKPTAGAAEWSATKPASYTFGSAGSKTLYAWAKDAAGNVWDSLSAGVVITLSFEVTKPVAGESVPTGAPYAVTWTEYSGAASYKVKLSIDGGQTWSTLATGLSGTTTTSWNVPTTIKKNITKAIVKVIAFNSNNVKLGVAKSGTFSIDVLTITAPAAGAIVPMGLPYTITWITNGTAAAPDQVVVKYSLNNGTTWKTAQGTLALDFLSFSWDVPAKTKNKVKVKVILKAVGNTVAKAVSGKFAIQ